MHSARLLLLLSFALSAAEKPFLQAIATLYPAADLAIPAALATAPNEAKSTDGATWKGTSTGLWRTDPKATPENRRRYFASRRWLPDDNVLSLAPDAKSGMWVRTQSGVSHIEFRPLTLTQKADQFEERVRLRHIRHGFVSSSGLAEPGNLATNRTSTSDNDGLWTAMYAAGECLRYAFTKSPAALESARNATLAILKLEQVTGKPGLPARSYITPGEQRPRDGIWFPSPDGSLIWKGDTSSDELVGHYLIFALAYDLLPDPALKTQIAATTRRLTNLILDNGLTLPDIHGLPTYWGRWDKEYFQSERGADDSPLNAIEILSFLKVAHHITREPRYEAMYRKLAIDEGYAAISTRYRDHGQTVNYSDEELAMLSFYPLFLYEKDPQLLAPYRKALDRWYENMARQKNPLWNSIYKVGQPTVKVDHAASLWTLERIPMDLISWTVKNSHRDDIQLEAKSDRFRRPQAKNLLPADERPIMKWNGNPFQIDGGNAGHSEDDGAFYLLPYWMGRYHKFW